MIHLGIIYGASVLICWVYGYFEIQRHRGGVPLGNLAHIGLAIFCLAPIFNTLFALALLAAFIVAGVFKGIFLFTDYIESIGTGMSARDYNAFKTHHENRLNAKFNCTHCGYIAYRHQTIDDITLVETNICPSCTTEGTLKLIKENLNPPSRRLSKQELEWYIQQYRKDFLANPELRDN